VIRGKTSVVASRSRQGGLVLHTLYFADEVRTRRSVEKADGPATRPEEMKLARRLVEVFRPPGTRAS
jgi:non-homologous end joining protein Ku